MTIQFRLPDLGEGIHEAEILLVEVRPGQGIQEGDPLIEVETDKAAVAIPSPVTGTVDQVLVSEGDTVKVGDVLVSFTGKEEEEKVEAEVSAPRLETDRKRPVPAAPSTRRIARELGVDLYLVPPTGPKGLVTAEDVRNFHKAEIEVAMPSQEPPPPAEPHQPVQPPCPTDSTLPDFSKWGEIERKPFRSIRRKTAERMSKSWSTIPHVNCQDLVDVTLLEDFRQKHKDEIRQLGGRLTMTVFAVKAAATALKEFPEFNATLDEANGEIIIKHYFHIGVAVDTPHGLMVPVIRNVDRKSIREISIELEQALTRARERTTDRDELVGGTFTITNAGAIGGSHFSAIINHPEIAILGMGQARMQPAVITDEDGDHTIEPRLMMPVILCFDHRVADGADAIRFMQVIIKVLQDPDELLISMI